MNRIPNQSEIQQLIKEKAYDKVINILKPFIKSYAKSLKHIIQILENKEINEVIIPEIGGVTFMRAIQQITKNRFNMHPAPLSNYLGRRSEFLKHKIRDIIDENFEEIKRTKILRIGFIDEVVSGTSIRDFRKKFENGLHEILSKKYKSFLRKEVDYFKELKGVTIEFYEIGIVGLFNSWFNKKNVFKMEHFTTTEIKQRLKELRGNWVKKKDPVKEFLEIVDVYSNRLNYIYSKCFDNKVKPIISTYEENTEKEIKLIKHRSKQDKSTDNIVQLKTFLFNFVVSLLFTEDVKEFAGVEYKYTKEFPIALRINNKLFKKLIKAINEFI